MTFNFCEFNKSEVESLAALLSGKLTKGCTTDECLFLADLFTKVGINLTEIANNAGGK